MWLFELSEWYLKRKGIHYRTPKAFSSRGERMVASVLSKFGIEFQTQFPFHYLHVDFAIMKDGKLMFIEYDGIQHYQPVKKFGGMNSFIVQFIQDRLLNWQCKDEGIPMLRIKYNSSFRYIERKIKLLSPHVIEQLTVECL